MLLIVVMIYYIGIIVKLVCIVARKPDSAFVVVKESLLGRTHVLLGVSSFPSSQRLAVSESLSSSSSAHNNHNS